MNFSRDLLEDIRDLYTNISTQNTEILNEESDFYNEEFANIFEDFCTTICISLLSEGYSAAAVLDYIDSTSEDDLIDYYINSDISNLSEDTISEEYFIEQYEILSEALPLIAGLAAGAKLAGKVLLGKAARAAIAKGASSVGRGLATAAKRAMGPGARKMLGSAASKLKCAVNATKGALSKLPGPIKTAGKWALGGAAFEAGSRGVKKLMDGSGKKSEQPKSQTPAPPRAPSATPASPAPSRAPSATPASPAPPKLPSGTQKPATDTKLTPMQQWAKANPKLADRVKPGQSGYDEISAKRDKPGPNEKQDQTPTTGPKTTPEQDKNFAQQAMTDVKAQQEREKKKLQQQQPVTTKEAYSMLADYFIITGQAESISEAYYILSCLGQESVNEMVIEMGDYLDEAAADQSDKQIEKGVKTTYKAQNVLDNQHQGRSKGLNKLPRGKREEKAKRMEARLKARRKDLFGERDKREDSKREQLKKMLGL